MCVASKLLPSKLNKDEKHTCATMVGLAPAPCLEFTISMMVAPSYPRCLIAHFSLGSTCLHSWIGQKSLRVSATKPQDPTLPSYVVIMCWWRAMFELEYCWKQPRGVITNWPHFHPTCNGWACTLSFINWLIFNKLNMHINDVWTPIDGLLPPWMIFIGS